MNSLNELYTLLCTLRARTERLTDLRVPIDFDCDEFYKAEKNLSRLDKRLTAKLHDAERAALAAL